MAVLGEIRKRPILLMGIIAIALLAFLVNPDTFDKFFGQNPNILGSVNGDDITREEYDNQLFSLRQQYGQNAPKGLENMAWNNVVQAKLIKQEFEKMGFEMTEDYFWNNLQFDPQFTQDKSNFDSKGNFKLQEFKTQIEALKANSPQQYNQWLKTKETIEYRMMATQLFNSISAGVTMNNKVAETLIKERDLMMDLDFVKVDYNAYAQKNPVKVTTKDLENYIKRFPNRYQTEENVNLGLVYFPSKPSAEDDAKVKNEITKLYNGENMENFTNTENDSMFVVLNSDLPLNNGYFGLKQLPKGVKDWVKTAGKGQAFGPYKEGDYYIVSKLMDKKPSDSTLSRHILIAYEGSPAGQGVKRTKEEAKKLADSIGSVIKANPSKFVEYVKLSDDKGSAQKGGALGWTTPNTPFAPEFKAFLAKNKKGATGVVETQFGYHIINVQDKKSGAMTYRLANLAKTVRPSEKTETKVDKDARDFIKKVEGKSFTDFENIAKKGNHKFTNPKTVKRFDGQLQGLGTDKDNDIIAWAFDEDRKDGDTGFFTVEGTGDRIIAHFKSRSKKGLMDAESQRLQLEMIVRNEMIAKKISEKITKDKLTSLEAVASAFGGKVESGQINVISPRLGSSIEPKVAGMAYSLAKGKVSAPVQGNSGVFVMTKKSETTNKQPGDLKQFITSATQRNAQIFGNGYMQSLKNNADIEDYRIKIWDKLAKRK